MEQSIKTIEDGFQEWCLPNGKHHRENGPAIIWPDGTEVWYWNGKRHREDGPAVIHPDGTEEYWLNDKQLEEDSLILKLIQEKERRKEVRGGAVN